MKAQSKQEIDDKLTVGYKRKRDQLKPLNPLKEADRLSKKRQVLWAKLEKMRMEYDKAADETFAFYKALEVKCDEFRNRVDNELKPLISNVYDQLDYFDILK